VLFKVMGSVEYSIRLKLEQMLLNGLMSKISSCLGIEPGYVDGTFHDACR